MELDVSFPERSRVPAVRPAMTASTAAVVLVMGFRSRLNSFVAVSVARPARACAAGDAVTVTFTARPVGRASGMFTKTWPESGSILVTNSEVLDQARA
jgi:uncharacterized protein (DUF58 family)